MTNLEQPRYLIYAAEITIGAIVLLLLTAALYFIYEGRQETREKKELFEQVKQIKAVRRALRLKKREKADLKSGSRNVESDVAGKRSGNVLRKRRSKTPSKELVPQLS